MPWVQVHSLFAQVDFVEPVLEELVCLGILFGQLDYVGLGFHDVAGEGCFEVSRVEAEEAFVVEKDGALAGDADFDAHIVAIEITDRTSDGALRPAGEERAQTSLVY